MTETPSSHKLPLDDDSIRQYIAEHGSLEENQKITGAILLYVTEEVVQGRTVYGRHRMYPLGPMNPHDECGLLMKAAHDAVNS